MFPDMPDKNKVWNDFSDLIRARDEYVRTVAVNGLVSLFPSLEDKDSFWKELVELTDDKEEYVQRTAADTLSKVFPDLPDRKKAYSELVNFADKNDNSMLKKLLVTLESGNPPFSDKYEKNEEEPKDRENERVEEKERARDEQTRISRRLTSVSLGPADDSNSHIQKDEVKPFVWTHSYPPEKNEVIKELINLSSSPEKQSWRDIESLLALYSRYSGEMQDLWNELLKITGGKDTGARRSAGVLLPYIFPGLEDKSRVLPDLLLLTESQDAQLRKTAAEIFATSFEYSENKQRTWDEFVRLASFEDRGVRRRAVLAISSAYAEVPDKGKAWRDLLKLSVHTDSFVQRTATRALGPAFFQVPDKTQAWRDLQVLTDNSYIYVRRYAFRSLARASLWRALKAENEAAFIFGLKEAVKYYEKAAETFVDANIPEFYLPFYEALLFILFGDRPGRSRLESGRYLTKMTNGLKEQKENQQVLEALEQFTELLRNAENLAKSDLSVRKKLLETCILTFDRYSSLFESLEEKEILAPKKAKKEHHEPGKAILEKVEKKKSFVLRNRKK